MGDQAYILKTFHRFRPPPSGEGREIRDDFPRGLTVTAGQDNVTSEDIADWIDNKGLACRPEDKPRDEGAAPPATLAPEETDTHA